MTAFHIDVDTLQRVLPPFTLYVQGGYSNLVNDILAPSKITLRAFSLSADNDSTLALDGIVRRLETGSMRLDSIFIGARQHDRHLHLDAGVENRPGNLDQWHRIDLNGQIDGHEALLGLHQQNLQGKTGFELGFRASAEREDSTLTLNIKPFDRLSAISNGV